MVVLPATGLESTAFVCAMTAILAIAVIEPKALPATTLTLLAVALAFRARQPLTHLAYSLPTIAIAALSFMVWGLVTAFWAISPSVAVARSATGLMIVCAAIAVDALTRSAAPDQSRRLGLHIIAGFAIGAAYLLFEGASGLSLRKVVAPLFSAEPKLAAERLNRNSAVLLLFFWPTLLFVGSEWRHRHPALPLSLLAATTLAAIFLLDHETSKLAVIGSGVIWIIARWKERIAFALMHMALVIAVVGVVPIALVLGSTNYRDAAAIPETVRARFSIWSTTAQEVLHRPIFGIGAGNTPVLSQVIESQATDRTDVLRARLDHHSHNVYLQTWLEFGAVGAALLLTLGWQILSAISSVSPSARPFALATFAVAGIQLAATWGLWQVWYQFALMLTVLVSVFAVQRVEQSTR
jgi:O-antigen ligase